MDTLLALEMINSSQNLKGLRHLYDVVEAQVRGLKALGVSPDSYGTLLSSVFLSKLPHDLRLDIARESTDDELSQLEKLLEITEADIKAREKAGCSVVPAKTKVKPPAPTGHALPAMSGPTPCKEHIYLKSVGRLLQWRVKRSPYAREVVVLYACTEVIE